MLDAEDLGALWVVGANPMRNRPLAARGAFVVVQELFLNETAKAANVILPAASAYEKSGTVTNVCGELQRIKRATETVGTKTDLEIIRLTAQQMGMNMAFQTPDEVLEEIRTNVPGYGVQLSVLNAGGAVQVQLTCDRTSATTRNEFIRSAGDTLFTSGTLGRYSTVLNSVLERDGGLYSVPPGNPAHTRD
jgi:NADH-quinone oxidoreductase subunit G